ncbi:MULTISPECIES: hypothetical protein [Bacillus cereus group]|uniref:Uncharacterized protein n=1 Tax=Bacillus thuringiensis serovar iberica TaxID=180866 RepID=A0A9X6L9I5_BACTU|nr:MULTISPECIES: hypothetical protein [Bacillus cereus group]HDR5351057.1 hypothetical protein [Bacillus thuringiensis]MEB9620633.1 hypothetical protein [Bacillus cereus]OUB40587.1 hypothetical protein BK741_30355 [Bacillus thuringiensis serovar iberica]UDV85111.1 hypothetical protein HQJ03_028440 [Bacillus cereus]UDV90576.1 hypothetical protein HQG80_027835 [Bacillus cereus]
MEKVIEKNLEWIDHLDALFTTNASTVYRNNPSFYYYPDVQIEIESDNINIICRKLEDRTRFLFGDCYGRRIYFTDVDIINIIVNSKKEVYDVICDILMLYISNPITEEVNFKISDQDFYYKSIVGNSYDRDKLEVLKQNSFETTADLNIKYIDLITLISLIINKEFLVDMSRGTGRVLRQAKKFLILSKFYKESEFLVELKNLRYPLKKIEDVYYNSSIAKDLDVIFDKITL